MKLILDNGREITLSQELASKIEEEIKVNEKTRNFATLKDDFYWWIGMYDKPFKSTNIDDEDIDNCIAFTSKEFAEKVAFKQLMERKLLAFKDEYDNVDLYWDDNDKIKYRLFYNETDKEIEINFNYEYKQQGSIYFSSKEIAEKCIEMYKEDLIKYFEMDIW